MGQRGRVDKMSEEADDLLALAAAHGYPLTRQQLARWHRAGVVGRPIQVSRGVHGSESWYPPGTGSLLLEACELRRSERRLDRIVWTLWWRGLTLPGLAARQILTESAYNWARTFRQLVDEKGQLTEKAEQELDNVDRAPLPKPLRRIRRRVGTENFAVALQTLLLAMSDPDYQLGTEGLELTEKALGTDRARTDILGSTGKPWFEGDPQEDLANMRTLMAPDQLEGLVEVFSDDELDLARDEVRRFLTGISDVTHVMRMTMDDWAYGMAAWDAGFDEIADGPPGQAMIVLGWLSAKAAGLGQNMTIILDTMAGTTLMRQQFEILVELRLAIPAVGDAIPLEWLGRPMKDPAFQQTINETFAGLRKIHGEEIDAFLASRSLVAN